jgi:hypothetical protein
MFKGMVLDALARLRRSCIEAGIHAACSLVLYGRIARRGSRSDVIQEVVENGIVHVAHWRQRMLKWDARHAPPPVRGELEVERMPSNYRTLTMQMQKYSHFGNDLSKKGIWILIRKWLGYRVCLRLELEWKAELWQVMESNNSRHGLPEPSMRSLRCQASRSLLVVHAQNFQSCLSSTLLALPVFTLSSLFFSAINSYQIYHNGCSSYGCFRTRGPCRRHARRCQR